MSKVKVASFGVSLDGFSAGPHQDLENPLGQRGGEIFSWFFPTDTFAKMHGGAAGEKGIDNDFASRGFENIGAWILGRNMFGPVRGPWPDDSWKGWWGDDPPYHVPTFVLTHHARPSLEMKGRTTFHFITEGPEVALQRALEAAKGKDIRIGGGASTVRQYLLAGKIDEMHLVVSPVMLGEGEHLYRDVSLPKLGFHAAETKHGERATHIILKR